MKMEAVQTSEMLVNSYQCTWHYNPEDSHLHIHHRENLKSYPVCLCVSQHRSLMHVALGITFVQLFHSDISSIMTTCMGGMEKVLPWHQTEVIDYFSVLINCMHSVTS
jgi:hypothetical protein